MHRPCRDFVGAAVELSVIRSLIHDYNETEQRWEETFKEVDKPEIQIRLPMHTGHWYLGCTHSTPEPSEPV